MSRQYGTAATIRIADLREPNSAELSVPLVADESDVSQPRNGGPPRPRAVSFGDASAGEQRTFANSETSFLARGSGVGPSMGRGGRLSPQGPISSSVSTANPLLVVRLRSASRHAAATPQRRTALSSSSSGTSRRATPGRQGPLSSQPMRHSGSDRTSPTTQQTPQSSAYLGAGSSENTSIPRGSVDDLAGERGNLPADARRRSLQRESVASSSSLSRNSSENAERKRDATQPSRKGTSAGRNGDDARSSSTNTESDLCDKDNLDSSTVGDEDHDDDDDDEEAYDSDAGEVRENAVIDVDSVANELNVSVDDLLRVLCQSQNGGAAAQNTRASGRQGAAGDGRCSPSTLPEGGTRASGRGTEQPLVGSWGNLSSNRETFLEQLIRRGYTPNKGDSVPVPVRFVVQEESEAEDEEEEEDEDEEEPVDRYSISAGTSSTPESGPRNAPQRSSDNSYLGNASWAAAQGRQDREVKSGTSPGSGGSYGRSTNDKTRSSRAGGGMGPQRGGGGAGGSYYGGVAEVENSDESTQSVVSTACTDDSETPMQRKASVSMQTNVNIIRDLVRPPSSRSTPRSSMGANYHQMTPPQLANGNRRIRFGSRIVTDVVLYEVDNHVFMGIQIKQHWFSWLALLVGLIAECVFEVHLSWVVDSGALSTKATIPIANWVYIYRAIFSVAYYAIMLLFVEVCLARLLNRAPLPPPSRSARIKNNSLILFAALCYALATMMMIIAGSKAGSSLVFTATVFHCVWILVFRAARGDMVFFMEALGAAVIVVGNLISNLGAMKQLGLRDTLAGNVFMIYGSILFAGAYMILAHALRKHHADSATYVLDIGILMTIICFIGGIILHFKPTATRHNGLFALFWRENALHTSFLALEDLVFNVAYVYALRYVDVMTVSACFALKVVLVPLASHLFFSRHTPVPPIERARWRATFFAGAAIVIVGSLIVMYFASVKRQFVARRLMLRRGLRKVPHPYQRRSRRRSRKRQQRSRKKA